MLYHLATSLGLYGSSDTQSLECDKEGSENKLRVAGVEVLQNDYALEMGGDHEHSVMQVNLVQFNHISKATKLVDFTTYV